MVISLPIGMLAAVAAASWAGYVCREPLARTIYEAREMVKAVRRYGRAFRRAASSARPAVPARLRIARNGYIGELKEVYARCWGFPCHVRSAENLCRTGSISRCVRARRRATIRNG